LVSESDPLCAKLDKKLHNSRFFLFFIFFFFGAFEVTEVWDFGTGHEVHVQLGHTK